MTLFTCRKAISVRILVDKRDIGYPNQPRLGKKSHLLGIIEKKSVMNGESTVLDFQASGLAERTLKMHQSVGWSIVGR